MYGQPYYYPPMQAGQPMPMQQPMMPQPMQAQTQAPMDQLAQLRAQQQPQPAQQQSGIIWVQGEEGAKAYLVAAGNSVMLMDSENTTFYLKSTDASGMPMPLKIFDYVERVQPTRQVHTPVQTPTPEYVTRAEFDQLADQLAALNRELGVGANQQTEAASNG